jgi:hypothetical protein
MEAGPYAEHWELRSEDSLRGSVCFLLMQRNAGQHPVYCSCRENPLSNMQIHDTLLHKSTPPLTQSVCGFDWAEDQS